jgi:hypothetical protein
MKKPVFLTRGEICISSNRDLSIHLKPDDKRWKDICLSMCDGGLKIVTINPTLDNFFRIYKGCWYLISGLEYVNSYDHEGYLHFHFNYKFDANDEETYNFDRLGIDIRPKLKTRLLTSCEVNRFKKTLTI